MKIKATTSFAGAVTMAPGEIRDVADEYARDYIRAGFAEAVDTEAEPETETETETEPSGAEEAPAAEAAGEPKKSAKRRK